MLSAWENYLIILNGKELREREVSEREERNRQEWESCRQDGEKRKDKGEGMVTKRHGGNGCEEGKIGGKKTWEKREEH